MPKVAITSHGCPRNLSDSGGHPRHLQKTRIHPYRPIDQRPDILVINTFASFIKPARDDLSILYWRRKAQERREGQSAMICGLPEPDVREKDAG